MKTCTTCGETLPLSQYHRDSRSADGYRAQCKRCRCAAVKEWYDATKPERKRRRDEAFEANPERRRAWDRERYQRDRDKRLEQAIEQALKRRASMREREYDEGITRKALRRRDGDQCFYCGTVLDFTKVGHGDHPESQATIEHLHRISDGGTHTWANVVLACWRCNSGRGNRDWRSWAVKRAA